MTDKKIDRNIKKTRDFIESWKSFYTIFKGVLSKSTIDKKKEEEFLSTKGLISVRYEDLMDDIGVRPSMRVLKSDSIYNVLSLDELSTISDESLRNIGQQWKNSFSLLEALLSRLERNKKRLKNFSRFSIIIKNRKKKAR
ncbi:MAG: hypothetical protein ISS91_02335 [Candidatus Omnitrophica bacterium]|nr:hypothetical protein [Candidatus Omnitrophota bacterium]